jgi:catechol 2,3-dioxygenase-like lactoylglutathione lyase family enzyme
MPNLKGLAHFTIPVSDVARSEAFYTGVLGMKVIEGLPPDAGTLLLRCGNVLEVIDLKAPAFRAIA